MSRLALWVAWYWRITSRPTTKTFHPGFPILSNMNASITLGMPRCSFVPPLVSFYLSFFATISLWILVSLWKWCTNKITWQLMQIFDICIRTVWSSTNTNPACVELKPASEICFFLLQVYWSLQLPLKGSFKHGLSCCPSSVACLTRRTTTLVRSAHHLLFARFFLL